MKTACIVCNRPDAKPEIIGGVVVPICTECSKDDFRRLEATRRGRAGT